MKVHSHLPNVDAHQGTTEPAAAGGAGRETRWREHDFSWVLEMGEILILPLTMVFVIVILFIALSGGRQHWQVVPGATLVSVQQTASSLSRAQERVHQRTGKYADNVRALTSGSVNGRPAAPADIPFLLGVTGVGVTDNGQGWVAQTINRTQLFQVTHRHGKPAPSRANGTILRLR